MKCIASESVPLSKRNIWDIKKQGTGMQEQGKNYSAAMLGL
jgi:hypothetical protein